MLMMDPYVSILLLPSQYAIKYEQPLDAPSTPRSSSSRATRRAHLETLQNRGHFGLLGKSEAPLPLPKRLRNFIHPKQLSPFLERSELPFPDGEILSSYDEDVSFKRDRFTAWVKADPNDTLERRMVNVRKAFAKFREASVRRQEASPSLIFLRQQCTKPFSCSKKA